MEKSLPANLETGYRTNPLDAGSLRILFVSTADTGGGAEISARNLFRACRTLGHKSWLAVGRKRSDDPDIVAIPNEACRSSWTRFWLQAGNSLAAYEDGVPGVWRLRTLCDWIGEPRRSFANSRGHEDFCYPATWRLLDFMPLPDIIHCYNLHGAYFDLRALPWLSRQRPLILDLRDAWLLTGHCSHFFACERWQTGCRQCPDLTIYPAIRRDGAGFNWQRKKKIFSKSRFFVATPSQWLMQQVQRSILAPALLGTRVIPTGIDLSVFHPAEQARARAELGFPQDARILLFAANGIRQNSFKDYRTMRHAVHCLSERLPALFIALGEEAPPEHIGNAEIRFVPRVRNPELMASYYQAADIYLHAAVAETYPRTVLESLACGTPVVATAVGGIPEQIRSLESRDFSGRSDSTGVVVPPGDARSMADAVEQLLTNESLHRVLGENAAKDARNRFDLLKQATRYLDWYQEILHTSAHP
jgi:glycosyltransferase involved in cell wall biosynthesis